MFVAEHCLTPHGAPGRGEGNRAARSARRDVDDHAAIGQRQHLIEIELCDGREVLSEPGETMDDVGERLTIGRSRAPVAGDARPGDAAPGDAVRDITSRRR